MEEMHILHNLSNRVEGQRVGGPLTFHNLAFEWATTWLGTAAAVFVCGGA